MSIAALIALLEASKYWLIFIGCFSEGSVVMMATGVLAREGVVSFWPAFLVLMLGDILSDCTWYALGRFGGRNFIDRWGYLVGASPAIVDKVQNRFHQYHTTILMISKLTMGFGFAIVTLMTAGLLRVPFLRFVGINLAGGLIWVFALYSLGYHFGDALQGVTPGMKLAGFVAGGVFMLVFLKVVNKKLSTIEW